MKIQKSLVFSLLLVGLFSFSSLTAHSSVDKTSPLEKSLKSISKVLQKNLKTVNLDNYETSSKTVMIEFMINERAEMIVLSTSEKSLDATLKAKLNYKTIESGSLEYFKKYTIPVTFE
jgi:hypothetical protein